MKHECCEGARAGKFSRRYFLKQGGIALVGMSTMPAFLQRRRSKWWCCFSVAPRMG